MAQPIFDYPLPPALAVDEAPLDDETLDGLDEALVSAAESMPNMIALLVDGDVEEGDDRTSLDLVPEPVRRWEITDDGAAQWAMAHCAVIDTDVRTYAAQRDEWQERIDHWFAQQSTRLLHRRAFFQAHLIAYATARRETDPKAPKTLSLPSGQITSSDRAAVVKVLDDDTLAAWLVEHGLSVGPDGADLAVTTTKVYAVPLRKVLVTDGVAVVVAATGEKLSEMPPGLDIEQAHTTYDVKT